MKVDSLQIANLLILASERILVEHIKEWQKNRFPDKHLTFRVGSGLQTYHTKKTKNHHVITFGKKMILSKLTSIKHASGWTTGKEILSRKYFSGNVTPQTSLAAVVLHEFAHYIQVLNGHRDFGSVHNAEFYKILDRMHSSGVADKVLNFLNSYEYFKELQFFENSSEEHNQISIYDVKEHQVVYFKDRKNNTITDLVISVSKTKVYCTCYTVHINGIFKVTDDRSDLSHRVKSLIPKYKRSEINKGDTIFFKNYHGEVKSSKVQGKTVTHVKCTHYNVPYSNIIDLK